MNKPLVSVFIPAYNNPIYSKKTLQSIVEQDYRPIEVLFLDDCSPTSLEPMVEEFRKYENDKLRLSFFRHSKNLCADNFTFGFDHCTGKYVVNMPHDDWWTDKHFLSETVDLMEQNPECYFCVANSLVENTNNVTVIHLPLSMKNRDTWKILPGDVYINMLGPDCIGYPAWSGIVLNLPMARSMGAFHYPFTLSMEEAKVFGEVAMDSFAFHFLLSSIGSVAITEKVIGVRGQPETAICNVNVKQRKKFMGLTAFVNNYNIYKAGLNGKHAQAVKQRAWKIIPHYPVNKINLKVLKRYNYAIDACYLMLCCYLAGIIYNCFHSFHFNIKKRILRVIRDKEILHLISKWYKTRRV